MIFSAKELSRAVVLKGGFFKNGLFFVVLSFCFFRHVMAQHDISIRDHRGKLEVKPVVVGGVDVDNAYDWGAHVMYDDTEPGPYKYKMWWTRHASPSWSAGKGDTIWFAESKDGYRWKNAQLVIETENTDFEYAHASCPSVVKVNGEYVMFYEAGSYPNAAGSIYLAKSQDGINWVKHRDAQGRVMPVVHGLGSVFDIPENRDSDPNIQENIDLHWFVPPSVLYKNGEYILYYIDTLTTGADVIRRMTSTDSSNWNPISNPMPIVCFYLGNELKVSYSEALNRCVAVYALSNQLRLHPSVTGDDGSPNWWSTGLGANWWPGNWTFETHLVVSSDSEGIDWPEDGDITKMASNATCVSTGLPNANRQYPSILVDNHGNIFGGKPSPSSDPKTLMVYAMQGQRPDTPGNNQRQHADTWDLGVSAIQLDAFNATPLMYPPIEPGLSEYTSEIVPVPADYDGDGVDDKAVFVRQTSEWYVKKSTEGWECFVYGLGSDKPAPADYDGDGVADVTVVRSNSSLQWFGFLSGGGNLIGNYGIAGDVPVPGYWSQTGHAELGVCRLSSMVWYPANVPSFTFGWAGHDYPIPADYDGDGITDVGVFRQAEARWIIYGSSGAYFNFVYGSTIGDIPVPADYDGDQYAEKAVYRTSNNSWYITGFSMESWD